MAIICSLTADKAFGPPVQGCNVLDFTLLFEQLFLAIVPSACFISAMLWRVSHLYSEPNKTAPNRSAQIWNSSKGVLAISLICSQTSLLVLWVTASQYLNSATIAALVLSLISSLGIFILSWLEHSRSVSPPDLLCVYLLFSTMFDIVQTRTLWLRYSHTSIAVVFTIMLSIKFILLIAELQEKQKFLVPPFSSYPPEILGSIVNRVLFWWLNPLLIRGARSILNPQNLFSIDPNLSTEFLEEQFSANWNVAKNKCPVGERALVMATLSTVQIPLLRSAIPRLCLIGSKFAQPLLIYRVTAYLSSTDAGSEAIGKALIGATLMTYLGLAAVTMIRSMLVVSIYNKTQCLDHAAIANPAALTLMSTDTETICNNLARLDGVFASPIEVGIAIFLLEREVQLACLASVGCALLAVALSFFIASRGPVQQKKWNQAVQERVAITASTLNSIRSIKMLGVSGLLEMHICKLRDTELQHSQDARMLVMLRNIVANIPQIAGPLLTFTIFALGHGKYAVTPAQCFTTLALVALVTEPIQVFVHASTQLSVAVGCFKRIQDYLLLQEVGIDQTTFGGSRSNSFPRKEITSDNVIEFQESSRILMHEDVRRGNQVLSIRDASFSYNESEEPILKNISLDIHPSTLTIVTGSVGSGKSSLLKAIIGSILCVTGSCSMTQAPAYCSQEPWLPNVTIERAVIGPSDLEPEWYSRVMQACALDEEILILPQGDHTKVGSRGMSVSGGQKQRLALARALYSRKKFLVLDDVLSALDVITAWKVFDRVLGPNGLCKAYGITVVMACNDTERLHLADEVVFLNKGSITPEEPYHGKSEQVESYSRDPTTDTTLVSTEERMSLLDKAILSDTEIGLRDEEQDLLRRTGDVSLYQYYIKSLGWKCALMFQGFIIFQLFGFKFPDLWLMWWSTDNQFRYSLGTYLGVYAGCAGIQLVGTMLSVTYLLVILVPKSSRRLHAQLMAATMKAPYTFFIRNDIGTVLNRFSQDISQIDNQLASSLLMTVFGAGLCIAEGMLIAAGNRYIAITVPVIIVIIYALQKFYLRTSRQLRFLELEAQSPLYTHFLETASGAVTIRTFGWQSTWTAELRALLDTAQKPFYMLFCIQRWLNLVLDLMTATLAVTVITIAVELRSTVDPSAIGVSLVNILGFSSSLAFLITAWTQLETSLGAVARIRNYEADLPQEDVTEIGTRPPDAWPSCGDLHFEKVYANYNNIYRQVLQDINLRVRSGERMAICGPSGSGKSSLLLLLFRMLETSSGSLFIDGLDLRGIPCSIIRERLGVIPQDSLLLPGTLRFNLDPSCQIAEAILVSTLERLHLWGSVVNKDLLDAQMHETHFSGGQRQLLCLARVHLRKTQIKVLILDEMSSSVDPETEQIMFRVIKEDFAHATVLAVTHRLKCIRDFDRVAVMDAGRIIESGSPAELLRSPSHFKDLWEKQ